MGENIIYVYVFVYEKLMFLILIISVCCFLCIYLDLFFLIDFDFGWVKLIRVMMILFVMFFGVGFVFFILKIWVLKI